MRRFSSGLKEIIIYNSLVKKRQATEALDGLGRQMMLQTIACRGRPGLKVESEFTPKYQPGPRRLDFCSQVHWGWWLIWVYCKERVSFFTLITWQEGFQDAMSGMLKLTGVYAKKIRMRVRMGAFFPHISPWSSVTVPFEPPINVTCVRYTAQRQWERK